MRSHRMTLTQKDLAQADHNLSSHNPDPTWVCYTDEDCDVLVRSLCRTVTSASPRPEGEYLGQRMSGLSARLGACLDHPSFRLLH